MARIRTVKPELWTDEKVVELDYADRLLFIGLWNFVDDQGFIDYRPKRIKMQVFPADDVDVAAALQRLREVGLVDFYALANSHEPSVVLVRNWEKHQRVSNPAKPRYTPSDLQFLPVNGEPSRVLASPHDSYPAEGKGMEGKGKDQGTPAAPAAPPREDVDQICEAIAHHAEDQTGKRPTITSKWRDAARLLLDRDGYTLEQVAWMIQWIHRHDFWAANVLSVPKLRAQFPTLIAQAKRPDRQQQHRTGISSSMAGVAYFEQLDMQQEALT